LLTGEWLGWWSAFLLLLCVFFFCSVLLCFCFFSVSSSVSHGAGLLSMTGRMVAVGGGTGGGYADCSRWYFLLSLLLCFHFQDLAMALVVLLLFFLSVCVASVNNVLLSLPWLCC
jgi:hypothetical protein